MWNLLNILAADGLWFPILIDDERQGIKQWEMARARQGRGGKGSQGGRREVLSDRWNIFHPGSWVDGVTDLIRSMRGAFTAHLFGHVSQ